MNKRMMSNTRRIFNAKGAAYDSAITFNDTCPTLVGRGNGTGALALNASTSPCELIFNSRLTIHATTKHSDEDPDDPGSSFLNETNGEYCSMAAGGGSDRICCCVDAVMLPHYTAYDVCPLQIADCRPGTFRNINDMRCEAAMCPAGFWCPGEVMDAPNLAELLVEGSIMMYRCPKGTYGSTFGQSTKNCTAPCPRGRFGDTPAATSAADCLACPSGKFGSGSNVSAVREGENEWCEECEAGTYSAITGVTVCEGRCAAGRFSADRGALNAQTCTGNCSAGMWSHATGLSAAEQCSNCTRGEFFVNMIITRFFTNIMI